MTADVNVTAKLAEWEALYRKGVTIRPDPMPALLGFVREVLEGHEPDDEGRYCWACGSNAHGNALVPCPCPTEQAARKWIGGEG